MYYYKELRLKFMILVFVRESLKKCVLWIDKLPYFFLSQNIGSDFVVGIFLFLDNEKEFFGQLKYSSPPPFPPLPCPPILRGVLHFQLFYCSS